jgi:hypothetical protein
MNKSIYTSALMLSICFSAYSKLIIPVEEIYKPLSLPTNYWQINGIATEYATIDTSLEMLGGNGGTTLFSPYWLINNSIELHPLFPEIQIRLAQNSKIVDSTIQANGNNSVIGIRMTGIGFSLSSSQININGQVYFEDKYILSPARWIECNIEANYNNHNYYLISSEILIGNQIKPRYSIKYGINAGFSNEVGKYDLAKEYVRIGIPLNFQFSFNNYASIEFGTGIDDFVFIQWKNKFGVTPAYLSLTFQW